MTLKKTKEFFDIALPKKTLKTRCVQIGCHFEEVAEMMEALGFEEHAARTNELADFFKSGSTLAIAYTIRTDRIEIADAMGDQIVTAIGVMENFKMDSIGIVDEINRSNHSKFVDGKAVFDKNGKIDKPESYSKPNLEPYV